MNRCASRKSVDLVGHRLQSHPYLEGNPGLATKDKHLSANGGLDKAAVTAIPETPWKG
jgi:hypothetical protein